MEDFIAKNIADIRKYASSNGLILTEHEEKNDEFREGIVFKQKPLKGEKIIKGSTIEVFFNGRPKNDKIDKFMYYFNEQDVTSKQNVENKLGLNIENLIKDEIELRFEIEKISFYNFKKVNFSRDDGIQEDYILAGYCKTSNWHDRGLFIMLFTKSNGSYVLNKCVTQQYINEKNSLLYELINVDFDNRMEIAIYMQYSGNSGVYGKGMFLLKFIDNDFSEIFGQNLCSKSGVQPYSYNNEIIYKIDELNNNLVKIIFKINTLFDKDIYKLMLEKSIYQTPRYGIQAPYSCEVTYRFINNKYITNEDVYDFEKYTE